MKTFIIEMDEAKPCEKREPADICGHQDLMNKVWNHKLCKGDLNDRPAWCPLVEITPGGGIYG